MQSNHILWGFLLGFMWSRRCHLGLILNNTCQSPCAFLKLYVSVALMPNLSTKMPYCALSAFKVWPAHAPLRVHKHLHYPAIQSEGLSSKTSWSKCLCHRKRSSSKLTPYPPHFLQTSVKSLCPLVTRTYFFLKWKSSGNSTTVSFFSKFLSQNDYLLMTEMSLTLFIIHFLATKQIQNKLPFPL